MVSASDRVYYQGKPMDRLTYERLKSLNMLVRSARFGSETSDITLVQGIGGAAASGGTHATGGAYDITAFNYKKRVYGGRLLGGADWYRAYLAGVWSAHIHGVTAGVSYAADSAERQVTAMYAGKNGLANNGPDTGPRLVAWPLFVAPWDIRGKRGTYYLTADQNARAQASTSAYDFGVVKKGAKFTVIAVVNVKGVLWALNTNGWHVRKQYLTMTAPAPAPAPVPLSVRAGCFNLPGPDKLPNSAARVTTAAAQIKATTLSLVVFNELIGPGKDAMPNTPSSFAASVKAALGWAMITPTTAWNENYIMYDSAKVALLRQLPDHKIYVKVGDRAIPGRHLTQAIMKDLASGKEFYVGGTHLINGDEPGAAAQGVAIQSASATSAGGRPRIIAGDMNTDVPIKAFTDNGLKNCRTSALATTNPTTATYTNYANSKPSTNPEWIIDHIYVPSAWVVAGYTVRLFLNADGTYTKPRASDHELVAVSARSA